MVDLQSGFWPFFTQTNVLTDLILENYFIMLFEAITPAVLIFNVDQVNVWVPI